MAFWYQLPSTLNLISPTLKLNSLCWSCNLSILNSRPIHILELEPVFASVKTFAATTMANLSPSFDFLGCAVDGLGDFVSLSIYSSVHPGENSITKIFGKVVGNLSCDPLSNFTRITAIEVMKMLGVRSVGLSLSLEKGLPLAKPRTNASTNSIKNHKSLEASVVVGRLSDTVHSVPNSPMLEIMSLFGSTSSSPLLANLQPNRVHVENSGGVVGFEWLNRNFFFLINGGVFGSVSRVNLFYNFLIKEMSHY